MSLGPWLFFFFFFFLASARAEEPYTEHDRYLLKVFFIRYEFRQLCTTFVNVMNKLEGPPGANVSVLAKELDIYIRTVGRDSWSQNLEDLLDVATESIMKLFRSFKTLNPNERLGASRTPEELKHRCQAKVLLAHGSLFGNSVI